MTGILLVMFLAQFGAVMYTSYNHPTDRSPNWCFLSAVAGLILGSTGTLSLVMPMMGMWNQAALHDTVARGFAQYLNAAIGLGCNVGIAEVRYLELKTKRVPVNRTIPHSSAD